MLIESVFGGKATVTFAACCSMNFHVIGVDVIIVLILLIVIGFIVRVVCIHIAFLVLFILLEAFSILVKCLLIVALSFGMFFLLTMVCGRSVVVLLCI